MSSRNSRRLNAARVARRITVMFPKASHKTDLRGWADSEGLTLSLLCSQLLSRRVDEWRSKQGEDGTEE